MKPNAELKQAPWPSIRTMFLVLLLVALAIISATVNSKGQTVYRVYPVINEKCDTVKYNGIVIYKLQDGAAWVEENNSLSYYSKKYFDKWKRKHKNVLVNQKCDFGITRKEK